MSRQIEDIDILELLETKKGVFINYPPDFDISNCLHAICSSDRNRRIFILRNSHLNSTHPKKAIVNAFKNLYDLLIIVDIHPNDSEFGYWIEILLQISINSFQVVYFSCFTDFSEVTSWMNKISLDSTNCIRNKSQKSFTEQSQKDLNGREYNFEIFNQNTKTKKSESINKKIFINKELLANENDDFVYNCNRNNKINDKENKQAISIIENNKKIKLVQDKFDFDFTIEPNSYLWSRNYIFLSAKTKMKFYVIPFLPSKNHFVFELKLNHSVSNFITGKTLVLTGTKKTCELTAMEIHKQRIRSGKYGNNDSKVLINKLKNFIERFVTCKRQIESKKHGFTKNQDKKTKDITLKMNEEKKRPQKGIKSFNVDRITEKNSFEYVLEKEELKGEKSEHFQNTSIYSDKYLLEKIKDKNLPKFCSDQSNWFSRDKKICELSPGKKNYQIHDRISDEELNIISNTFVSEDINKTSSYEIYGGNNIQKSSESNINVELEYDENELYSVLNLNHLNDEILSNLISYGIGYIHSDLDSDDKIIIKLLFYFGLIDCLVTTHIAQEHHCETLIIKSGYKYTSYGYSTIKMKEIVNCLKMTQPKKCYFLINKNNLPIYKGVFVSERKLPLKSEEDKTKISQIENHMPEYILYFLYYDKQNIVSINKHFQNTFFMHQLAKQNIKFPFQELFLEVISELQKHLFIIFVDGDLCIDSYITEIFFETPLGWNEFIDLGFKKIDQNSFWKKIYELLYKEFYKINMIKPKKVRESDFILQQKKILTTCLYKKITYHIELAMCLRNITKDNLSTPYVALMKYKTKSNTISAPIIYAYNEFIYTNLLYLSYSNETLHISSNSKNRFRVILESYNICTLNNVIENNLNICLSNNNKILIYLFDMAEYEQCLFLFYYNGNLLLNYDFHKKSSMQRVSSPPHFAAHKNETIKLTLYPTPRKSGFPEWLVE